jgi:hypothetical protein
MPSNQVHPTLQLVLSHSFAVADPFLETILECHHSSAVWIMHMTPNRTTYIMLRTCHLSKQRIFFPLKDAFEKLKSRAV